MDSRIVSLTGDVGKRGDFLLTSGSNRVFGLSAGRVFCVRSISGGAFVCYGGGVCRAGRGLCRLRRVLGKAGFFEYSGSVVLGVNGVHSISPSIGDHFRTGLMGNRATVVSERCIPALGGGLKV